jgi:hypothetical protein
MTTLSQSASSWSAPPGKWLSIVAIAGFLWNLVGAVQFVSTSTATDDSLLAAGMTQDQAAAMASFPSWVTLVFAIGVVTSLAGCALLFLRHRLAKPVLGISAVAFGALWIAYALYGAFAAFGVSQIAIMTTVVVIAIGLYVASRRIPGPAAT